MVPSRRLVRPIWPILAALVGTVAITRPAALELKPTARAAFDRYVQLTETRMAAEIDGRAPFLWLDREPPTKRTDLLRRLANGEIISARLETRDAGREIDPGRALIHHWVGTVLMPGARLEAVATFVRDYERYPHVFPPLIRRARVLSANGDHYDVAMRTAMTKVITVVIDADYRIEYRALAPTKLYTRNVATNIHEVSDAGTASETRTPAERTGGFLWRLNTYCSFEERPEGTYEQCESISLTRDVPFGLGWIVKPFVTSIPRETLEFTLERVRQGVRAGG
jgi:hypothetical protein